jgi:predicted acyltransferase
MKNLNTTRLHSLDILRGLDIFILVFAGPFLFQLLKILNMPELEFLRTQLSHANWEGFYFWDLIMPLFMFIAGVSMPFSLSKYQGNRTYFRIVKRVFLLFFFGALVQGNLLKFDLHSLRLYSNTLQAIAVGYLIASVILLNFKTIKWQIIITSLLFATYYALMCAFGDFTPDGNFAETVDKALLGRWRDGVRWSENVWSFSKNYHYTWILSSLNFGITVMLGAFAGEIMRNGTDKFRNAKILFLTGIALVIAGQLVGLHFPIIKKIWSSSMTLYSGGLCFLAMAIFYWYIDCIGRGKWLDWLKIYGMNSIFAYVVSHVISFKSIPNSLFFGLKSTLGDYYPLLINFSEYLILFYILYLMYKNKIFLKV